MSMRDMIMHVCESKLPSMQDMIMCVKVNLLAVGVAGSHHLEVLMKLDGPSIHGSVTHHFLDGSNCLRGVSLIKEQHCVDGPWGIFWPSLLCWFFGFPGQGFCLFDLLVDVFCCGATVHLEIHRIKWGLQKFRRILPIHHKLDIFCSGTTMHLDIHRIKVVGCRGEGGASKTWTCFTYSSETGHLQWHTMHLDTHRMKWELQKLGHALPIHPKLDVFCSGATMLLDIHRMKWELQKLGHALPIHPKLDVFCSGATMQLDIHRMMWGIQKLTCVLPIYHKLLVEYKVTNCLDIIS